MAGQHVPLHSYGMCAPGSWSYSHNERNFPPWRCPLLARFPWSVFWKGKHWQYSVPNLVQTAVMVKLLLSCKNSWNISTIFFSPLDNLGKNLDDVKITLFVTQMWTQHTSINTQNHEETPILNLKAWLLNWYSHRCGNSQSDISLSLHSSPWRLILSVSPSLQHMSNLVWSQSVDKHTLSRPGVLSKSNNQPGKPY